MEYVAYAVIALAVAATILIKPSKPDKPSPATLSDFSIPTAEENRAIPVIFGTRMISGANVVWYGDLHTEEIKSDSGGKK